MISIAEPGHTDAMEFDDGKIMLGKHASLKDVCWERLVSHISRPELVELINGSALVVMGNWTMLPHMSDIWASSGRRDFAPHGRAAANVHRSCRSRKANRRGHCRGAGAAARFSAWVDVTLGLNLKEAREIARVLAIAHDSDEAEGLERLAAAIRVQVGLACLVIHPRGGASAATADGTASFAGPFVARSQNQHWSRRPF